MNKPIIIAHRGASAYAPENTMSAFRKAIEMNAGAIELDVHLTKDGEVAVIHDYTVDRTSNGKGRVRDITLEELRELDFGSWFSEKYAGEKIPVLEQVMELLSGRKEVLNIEIKNSELFYCNELQLKVVELIRKYKMHDRIIISSFNHNSLYEIKCMEVSLLTAPLYSGSIYRVWDYCREIGSGAIHPHYYGVSAELVAECAKNGIIVNPYTVDSPDAMLQLAQAGVYGIITNVPDVAARTLGL